MRKYLVNIILLLFVGMIWLVTGNLSAQDLENIGDKKPVRLTGSLSVGGGLYHISGIPERQNPYGYYFSANPTLEVYGVRLPFSIVVTEQGTQLGQPFNRFGVAPEYKWAKLYLGHNRMEFSPYTLASRTFLGAGVELNPGLLRVAAVYGRFNKATAQPNTNIASPQFTRMGMGGRLGVGNNDNFVDLIFFKAKDDLSSLNISDSLKAGISAHDNAVLGLSTQLHFLDKKLVFKADVGGSAFTRDLRGPEVPDVTENIGSLENIIKPNLTTNATFAGDASIRYNHEKFSIGSTYRRVEPDYKSLGINYLIDDVEALTIDPSFRLLEGKLSVSGSYGVQRNNLDDKRSASTLRQIGSANINYSPSTKFGISAQYSNFSITQQIIRDTLLNDSLLVDQVNHNINIAPRLTFVNENNVQNVVLVAGYQELTDNNPVTAGFGSSEILFGNLSYNLNFITSGWGFQAGVNYNDFRTALFNTTRYGGSIGVSKDIFKQKLNLSLSGTYNINEQLNVTGEIISIAMDTRYRITDRQSLSVSASVVNNQTPGSSFIESKGRLNYRIAFR